METISIKEHGNIKALHADLFEKNGVFGGKAFLAFKLCAGKKGIVTCGSRHSVQVLTFARVCDSLSIPCEVHIPQGLDTEITLELQKTKAVVHKEFPAYNTVLNSRARENAKNLGYKFVPLGMNLPSVLSDISSLVPLIKDLKINRIIIPVGSGTTLIGVCQGLFENKLNIPILGVMVGMNCTKVIQKYSPYLNYTLVTSKESYSHPSKIFKLDDGYELNPYYEAKCIEYLQSNDLLWIVAR